MAEEAQVVSIEQVTFGAAEQAWFAATSGDVNPLHVDELAARRLPFGGRVVHGIHLVLASLAVIGRHAEPGAALSSMQVTFQRPVLVGSEVTITTSRTEEGWRARVDHESVICATVDAMVRAATVERSDRSLTGTSEGLSTEPRLGPYERSVDDLDGLVGQVAVPDVDVSTCPWLDGVASITGHSAEIMALSTVVGMHAPGLHSLFSGLAVEFDPEAPRAPTISFSVASVDRRFSRAQIDVTGSGVSGRLTAFVRSPPAVQPGPEEWSVRPRPEEFAGQTALVVGGSRGLGELTALMLAVGGARVAITYRTGVADAERVLRRVRDLGADGWVFALDVSDDRGPDDLRAALERRHALPTHLYYFATPPIFIGTPTYSDELRARFERYYCTDFERLVGALRTGPLIAALQPSSEAVEHEVRGLAEYADAKRSAEDLCRRLSEGDDGLFAAAPRWPRLETDQTATFMPTPVGDAAEVVLTAIRSLGA